MNNIQKYIRKKYRNIYIPQEKDNPWQIKRRYHETTPYLTDYPKQEKWLKLLNSFYQMLDQFDIPVNDLKRDLLINLVPAWNQILAFETIGPPISQRTLFFEQKNLESRVDAIEKGIREIFRRFKQIEKNLQNKNRFKPIPQKFRENEEFIIQQNWIKDQKEKYPDETIVYTIRNEEMVLLAHSSEETELFNKIDDLLEKNLISKENKIYFI